MKRSSMLVKIPFFLKKYICLQLAIITFTIITSSCDRSIGGNVVGGGGREGEVVVVLNEEFKQTRAAEVVDEFLCDSYLLLPQHEPMFNLYFIPWAKFADPFTGFRNIIKADINSKHKEAKATMQQQDNRVVVNMTAPNVEAFADLFAKHAPKIIETLNMNERNVLLEYAKLNVHEKLYQHILDKHKVKLLVPQNYNIRIDTTNFVWLTLEAEKLSLGLILYHFDYTNQEQFKAEYLLNYRDSVLQKYIKGPLYPNKMSYMTTARQPVAPIVKELTYNNAYILEMKGLWKVTEDFMSGPFLSVAKADLEGRRIVIVEGYIYYPGENKRKFMRRFEPVVYNFDFLEKNLKHE